MNLFVLSLKNRGRIFILKFLPTERAIHEHLSAFEPGFGFYEMVGLITEFCIDHELIARQHSAPKDSRPVAEGVLLTLGVYTFDGETRSTAVGNVDWIKAGSEIDGGVIIDHFTQIGDSVQLELGAAMLLGSAAEARSIIGREGELSYGATLPKDEKIEPYSVRYH